MCVNVVTQLKSFVLIKVCPLFYRSGNVTDDQICCITSSSSVQEEAPVLVSYGGVKRVLEGTLYNYTENPTISSASPSKAFYG